MIREEIIGRYAAGKDVLDVGGVGQNAEYNLWRELKLCAKSLTGIDIMPSNDKDIVTGNMETYSFGRKFDVIILGDVIEHVDNQGLLLDNSKKHLRPDGVLIVTTPNAKWFSVFKRTNPTHLLWHEKSTLTAILKKHGFRMTYFKYYYGNKMDYFFALRPFIARQSMLAVCNTEEG
ncbi:MAG: class I SAM-dependent methyltransferase [Candidatus Omnitrophota bacterium]|nr:class I SAM-dependent methyltransferase [Candidatus Omnitrophota bacterium]